MRTTDILFTTCAAGAALFLTALAAPALSPPAIQSRSAAPTRRGSVETVPPKLQAGKPSSPVSADIPERPEFLRDIAPILDQSGCSVAECHGKFGGRGGLALSLLTLSPEEDYDPIVFGERGRRVNFAEPEKSLLLTKATGQVKHAGGPRFAANSPQYRTLLRWLSQGAPFRDTDPRLARFVLVPDKVAFQKPGESVCLKAFAVYTDGNKREVTRQTVFSVTNDAMLRLDGPAVTGKQWGGGAVLGRYLGTVSATFFTLPQARKGAYPKFERYNAIDELVFENLRRLNVVPSDLCRDDEFVRRVTLDVAGRLPTESEVAAFLADTVPSRQKRARLINRLLDSDEYADLRAMRLADLLRVHPRKLGNGSVLGERAAALFYDWIWRRVHENQPWDSFVRELITARGSGYQVGPANFYRVETAPDSRMENLGQAFLGVRMSCARCHKHPFDRWTTDDYWNFSAFMGKAQLRGGRLLDEQVVGYDPGAQVRNDSVTGKNRGKTAPPTFLGQKTPAPERPDQIAALADWLTAPDNPFFARATVNRLWSYYLGRGVIHPVDDIRATTPESVPGLLDLLAKELVSSKYDIKSVIRLILNSRTYQLSAVPNETNRKDDVFFSHFVPRAMPAPVLLDMVNQATGVRENFNSFPERARAVQAAVPPQTEFLDAFGQSHREFLADIDPKLEPNLVQTLHMINSGYINDKVRGGETIQKALAGAKTDEELVHALYLHTLSRPPAPDELRKALTLFQTPLSPPASKKAANETDTTLRLVQDTGAKPAAPKPKSPQEVERDRREAATDLLWALVTSREFYFNH